MHFPWPSLPLGRFFSTAAATPKTAGIQAAEERLARQVALVANDQAVSAREANRLTSALIRVAEKSGASRLLDLSSLSPQAASLLTQQVARELNALLQESATPAPVLTVLRLPTGMNSLPEGLAEFGGLERLEAPGFAGAAIDLTGFRQGGRPTRQVLRVDVPGAIALQKISCGPSTQFALLGSAAEGSEQVLLRVNFQHRRKVQVVQIHEDKKGAQSGTHLFPGHVYHHRSPKPDDKASFEAHKQAHLKQAALNLNCSVKVSDVPAPSIACRHLAIKRWHLRLDQEMALKQGAFALPHGEMKARAPQDRLSYEKLSSVSAIQQTFSGSSVESDFDYAANESSRNHLVALGQWAAFVHSQFKELPPGQRRHLLLLSWNHAMYVELHAKRRDNGLVEPILEFYDPNKTATHLRTGLDLANPESLSLDKFLEPKLLSLYFGGPESTRPLLVCELDVRKLRSTNSQAYAAALPPDQGDTSAEKRSLNVEHAGDHVWPQELHLAVVANLVTEIAPRLIKSLNAMGQPGDKRRLELLNAPGSLGISPVSMAMRQVQGVFLDTLLRVACETLSPDQQLELFKSTGFHPARSSSRVGVGDAISRRCLNAVRSWVERLLWSELTDPQKTQLLMPPTSPDVILKALARNPGERKLLAAILNPWLEHMQQRAAQTDGKLANQQSSVQLLTALRGVLKTLDMTEHLAPWPVPGPKR